MNPTIRIALCWTLPWVLALCALLLLADSGQFQISANIHQRTIWLGGVALIALAFTGLVRASRYALPSDTSGLAPRWFQDGHLVALVIFWSLFPPAWFFVEYYALDKGLLLPRLGADGLPLDRVAALASARTYGDLATKVWAGSSAVIGALLAVSRR